MQRLTLRVSLSCAALALAACHDSDGGSGGAVSFDATVTNEIQARTNETAEPIEIGGTTFTFPTSPDAFDDVLPPDDGAVVPQ